MINAIHVVYFSPTDSTKKVVLNIANHLSLPIIEHDFTSKDTIYDVSFSKEDIVLFGFPVYGGRVPSTFIKRLEKIRGNHTFAIGIATYGNRAFEDALLEIQQTLEPKGFAFVSAAAIICEHNIVRSIASNRPDESDLKNIECYANTLSSLLPQLDILAPLSLPGNTPYKESMTNRMFPKADSTCIKCGICQKECPVQAIQDDIKTCDQQICIGCMRCIYCCPSQSRKVPKPAMLVVSALLNKVAKERREPNFYYASKKES